MIYIQISFTLYIVFILFNVYILLTPHHSFSQFIWIIFPHSALCGSCSFSFNPFFRFASILIPVCGGLEVLLQILEFRQLFHQNIHQSVMCFVFIFIYIMYYVLSLMYVLECIMLFLSSPDIAVQSSDVFLIMLFSNA